MIRVHGALKGFGAWGECSRCLDVQAVLKYMQASLAPALSTG